MLSLVVVVVVVAVPSPVVMPPTVPLLAVCLRLMRLLLWHAVRQPTIRISVVAPSSSVPPLTICTRHVCSCIFRRSNWKGTHAVCGEPLH